MTLNLKLIHDFVLYYLATLGPKFEPHVFILFPGHSVGYSLRSFACSALAYDGRKRCYYFFPSADPQSLSTGKGRRNIGSTYLAVKISCFELILSISHLDFTHHGGMQGVVIFLGRSIKDYFFLLLQMMIISPVLLELGAAFFLIGD